MWYLLITTPNGSSRNFRLAEDADEAAALVPAAKAQVSFPTNAALDSGWLARCTEVEPPWADDIEDPAAGGEYAARELAERQAGVKAAALVALGELNHAELHEVLIEHAETLKG